MSRVHRMKPARSHSRQKNQRRKFTVDLHPAQHHLMWGGRACLLLVFHFFGPLALPKMFNVVDLPGVIISPFVPNPLLRRLVLHMRKGSDARSKETTCRSTTSSGITNIELCMIRRVKRGRGCVCNGKGGWRGGGSDLQELSGGWVNG